MVDYEVLRRRVRDIVDETYKKLKSESGDYGELDKKCKQYCDGLMYRDKNIGLYVKERFKALITNELRDIQIAHPSDQS